MIREITTGPNLTSGMNGIFSSCSASMVVGGTNATVSFVMGIGEGVSMSDSATLPLLEIDMTFIYE